MINSGQMELSSLVRDNIDEILVRIIQFTNIHHTILTENIRNCRKADFVPRYVDVEDFAKVISVALNEHQRNQRLALCDSRTISFTVGGEFTLKSQVDIEAAGLVENDFEAFIELQKDRLRENILNNKAACALFSHKLQMAEMQDTEAREGSVKNHIRL